MALVRLIFLLLLALPAYADSSTGDAVVEAGDIARRVEKLFFARQFDAILELDKELRENPQKRRLSDGRWSITFLLDQLTLSSKNTKNYDEWLIKQKIADEWIAKYPDEAVPRIARAAIELGFAWAVRGPSFARDVAPERMEYFKQRVAYARTQLEQPAFEKHKHPLWFFYMLDIAKLQAWDPASYKALLSAGTKEYPGYEFLYFQATEYYQPIWHGSREQIRQFVDESVERTRATEGMVMYTRLYWYMLARLGDKTFDPGNAEWSPMKQGFERLMQDYPKSGWNLNAFAYYACMAGDWGTLKALLPKIGDDPAMAIWSQPSRYYTCIEKSKSPAR